MQARGAHLSSLVLLFLGCACATLSAGPGAQAPVAPANAAGSAVIGEVHASGSTRYTDDQIAAAAGLKPGDKVTREQIQAGADQLSSLGIFSLVNYRFTTTANKIIITFELKDATVVPVAFDNFPWLTDDELTAAI